VDDLVARCKQAERERDEARAENTIMRGLLAKQDTPCVYCGAETMATCPRGFPGCAQADDLLVGDDETMRRLRVERDEALCKPVVARWLDSHHAAAAEARVAQLEGALRECEGIVSLYVFGGTVLVDVHAAISRARAALDAARPADTPLSDQTHLPDEWIGDRASGRGEVWDRPADTVPENYIGGCTTVPIPERPADTKADDGPCDCGCPSEDYADAGENLTVWWWTDGLGVYYDVPVPYAQTLPHESALTLGHNLSQQKNVVWVKVFGASENDERWRWDRPADTKEEAT
jgi:hypothetical protein